MNAPELQRHPLSVAFGDMPKDEFDELVADVKKNGLVNAVVYLRDEHDPDKKIVLDGWHRYRACIEAGITPRLEPFDYVIGPAAEQVGDRKMTPAEFVIAQNAHRRHLSREQRRQIVVELLKAKPEASDRAIAAQAKVSPTTVGAVRSELESTVQVGQLTKRVGKDGKTRAKPAPARTEAPAPKQPTAAVIVKHPDGAVTVPADAVYVLTQGLLKEGKKNAAHISGSSIQMMAGRLQRLLLGEPGVLDVRVESEIQHRVQQEFERRHADLLTDLNEKRAKAHDEHMAWVERTNHTDDYLSLDEFRLIQSCLHPDREADPERKRRAFDIFKRLESRVNPDARRRKNGWRNRPLIPQMSA